MKDPGQAKLSADGAVGRARSRVTVVLVLLALLLLWWAPVASANIYHAELVSGAATVGVANDLVAVNGDELEIGQAVGGNGSPSNSWTWNAPTGESFSGFAYAAASFHATASTGGYVGGFGGGFVGTGLDGSTIVFPWTDDCQIVTATHAWTRGGGLAQNGTKCATSGNTTGWNLDNSEISSTTGDALSEDYTSLSLNVGCNSKRCNSGVVAGASATDLSAVVTDPDASPMVTRIGWDSSGASSKGWYQTRSSAPNLDFNVTDPGGVCFARVAYSAEVGGASGVGNDLVGVPATVTPNATIGREFASASPCMTSLAGQFALPSSLTSGVYALTVQTADASDYEAGGFSEAGAVNTAAGEVSVDNVVPSVSITDPNNSADASVQVTTGPSGLASLVCSDDGVTVSPTWDSGAMTGQSSASGGTLESDWSVPTGSSVNDVNCVATNNDLNGALSNPVATFSDPKYTPGTWTTATPSDPQVVTVTAGKGAELDQCTLDGAETDMQNNDVDEVEVTTSGAHTLSCLANADGDGSSKSQSSYQILVDDQSPTLAYTGATATDATNGTWVPGTPTISMVGEEFDSSGAANILSGISSFSCTVNGADAQTLTTSAAGGYAASFRLTENGIDRIVCTPTSGAGVVGSPVTEVVDVDNPSAVSDGGNLTSYGSSVLIDNGDDPYSDGPSQSTWYHAEQQVTITATNTGGGSPIASIACKGATLASGNTTGSWPNDSGSGTEQITLTVRSPGGDLSCAATDSAGNTYALGAYDFQIDDTAPTGAFVAQTSWSSPDQLELSVMDPDGVLGSGVAVVRVYAQAGAGGELYDLGLAQYDSSTDDYEVTVDDGVMPAGTYSFFANVSDVAGNQSQVTAGPSGTVETLSLPLRSAVSISTQSGSTVGQQAAAIPNAVALPAGVASAADGANFVTSRQANAGGLVGKWRQPSLARAVRAASTRPNVDVTKLRTVNVPYGASIMLRGRLLHRGQPLRQQALTVWRVVSGGTGPQRVAATVTNGAGCYSVRVPGGASGMLYVVYAGNKDLRAVAAELMERFSGQVRIAMGALVAGRTAAVRGQIDGGHVPSGGLNVAIQYTIVGHTGWGTFQTGHADADGRFKISFPVGSGDANLTYRLRVIVLRSGSWPYTGATSNVLTRHVS